MEELATALIAAETKTEREALLAAHKELVSSGLVRELNKRSKSLFNQGKVAQAMAAEDIALAVAIQLGDKSAEAGMLVSKGVFYRLTGNYKAALEYSQRALTLAEESGDRRAIGDAINAVGVVHSVQGDLVGAIDYFERSLRIRTELGDRSGVGSTLNNLGLNYQDLGDYARALEYYIQSLRIKEEVGDKAGVAISLSSIGRVHIDQGNYRQALDYFQRSLEIRQTLDGQPGMGKVLNNLGVAYGYLAEYPQAREFFNKSLTINEKVGDEEEVANALDNIGGVSACLGDYTEALDHFQKALKIREEMGQKRGAAYTLNKIGEMYLKLEKYQSAIDIATRSAALATESGLLGYLWRAEVTAGQAYRALNQLAPARQALLKAVSVIEEMRRKVAGGDRDVQSFFEDKVSPYYDLADLAITEGDLPGALNYAERAKSRALLDILSAGKINITKSMTADELSRDRALTADMASLNLEISRQKAQAKIDDARMSELRGRLEKARLAYESFRTDLYAAHPELKVHRGEAPLLTLNDTVNLLGDDQTALLDYVVGENRSYLLVITKGARGSPELAVYPVAVNDRNGAEALSQFRRSVADRDLTVKNRAQQVYDLLLRPAEKQLRKVKRLCIVPDGPLWNVPFQALYDKASGYLLERYAISYAPSLTALREMARSASELKHAHPGNTRFPQDAAAEDSKGSKGPTHELLALGNPSLDPHDTQVVTNGAAVRRDEPLAPLQDAEREVRSLGQLYGPSRSKVLVGPDATEEALKLEAGNYAILHFATHAVLDDRSPMYSRIVLSRRPGVEGEDGLLEAWEVMQLDLKAQMTVLSACETGQGRVAPGEGIIGMSWAFFVAGCPTAVVSQWKVDAARTADLMIRFHKNLVQGASGKTPLKASEALRQAELSMLHSSYNHPAYWAGFILVGSDQ